VARGTAHAPAEARRAGILDAALAVFAERGYHGATMDEVAARAGLSKGSLYWHFESKREVFLALFDRALEATERDWQRARGSGGPEQVLRAASEALLASARETAQLVGVTLEYLAHASRDSELRARFERLYAGSCALVEEQIRRGAREGRFRALDARAVAMGIVAAFDGLLLKQNLFPGSDVEKSWRETVEVLLRGLA
jgi:AcrR family transcriptional regulator